MLVMLLENYRINCYLDVANMMFKPPPAEHPSDDELPSAGDVNSLAHLFKNWGWRHSILFLVIMIAALACTAPSNVISNLSLSQCPPGHQQPIWGAAEAPRVRPRASQMGRTSIDLDFLLGKKTKQNKRYIFDSSAGFYTSCYVGSRSNFYFTKSNPAKHIRLLL